MFFLKVCQVFPEGKKMINYADKMFSFTFIFTLGSNDILCAGRLEARKVQTLGETNQWLQTAEC